MDWSTGRRRHYADCQIIDGGCRVFFVTDMKKEGRGSLPVAELVVERLSRSMTGWRVPLVRAVQVGFALEIF